MTPGGRERHRSSRQTARTVAFGFKDLMRFKDSLLHRLQAGHVQAHPSGVSPVQYADPLYVHRVGGISRACADGARAKSFPLVRTLAAVSQIIIKGWIPPPWQSEHVLVPQVNSTREGDRLQGQRRRHRRANYGRT